MTDFDDEPDQDKRIEKLRSELERLGGGVSQHPELSADLEEAFLKHILAFETAEPTTLLEWLENAGLEVPPSDQLDDAQLNAKLWEVINRMASLGAYLHNTNHLSDRELYAYLFDEGLREDAVLFPEDPSYVYGLDLLGSGSDEDMQLYMKYFADDESGSSGRPTSPISKCPHTKTRRSIATRICQRLRLDEVQSSTFRSSAQAKAWTLNSSSDHGARAFVGEHFRQQRITRRAVDDVRALHPPAQQVDDVLQLGNHPASRRALCNKRLGFVRGQPRELRLRLAGA